MDIYVNAKGRNYYKPNQITLNFNFNFKSEDYELALTSGVENVTHYVNFLVMLGFKKEEIKTRSFSVSENKVYNEQTRRYEKDGYLFNQMANLSFDYDIEKLSVIMEETAKLKNPPIYYINFNLKDDKKAEEDVIAIAYKEAEFQANAIAKASGKKVKECVKVSFEPFDAKLVSETRFDCERSFAKCAAAPSTREQIQQTFVPEDVLVYKELYCLFVAE